MFICVTILLIVMHCPQKYCLCSGDINVLWGIFYHNFISHIWSHCYLKYVTQISYFLWTPQLRTFSRLIFLLLGIFLQHTCWILCASGCLWVIPCQISAGCNLIATELITFLWDCIPSGDEYSCTLYCFIAARFWCRHPELSENSFFGHKLS
jgi:hypothetical protein